MLLALWKGSNKFSNKQKKILPILPMSKRNTIMNERKCISLRNNKLVFSYYLLIRPLSNIYVWKKSNTQEKKNKLRFQFCHTKKRNKNNNIMIIIIMTELNKIFEVYIRNGNLLQIYPHFCWILTCHHKHPLTTFKFVPHLKLFFFFFSSYFCFENFFYTIIYILCFILY